MSTKTHYYDYDKEYQTLLVLDENQCIINSVHIPEKDLGRISMLLWSLEIDKHFNKGTSNENHS
jgi:hypothetical protein